MKALPTSRLLPYLMATTLVMIGVKSYDFWQGWSYGTPAQASTEAATHPAAAAETHAAPQPAKPDGNTPVTPAPEPAKPQASGEHAPQAQSEPEDVPGEYTPAEVQVLQSLSQRRAELDRRAADLEQRETLLEAAQKNIESKVGELQSLKAELQSLLHNVDEQQNERIKSLVKIYETMKPREAAAILETLDMAVTLDVLEQMKETKSAPILAAMDPQKASAITVEMSKRHQLPSIPQ